MRNIIMSGINLENNWGVRSDNFNSLHLRFTVSFVIYLSCKCIAMGFPWLHVFTLVCNLKFNSYSTETLPFYDSWQLCPSLHNLKRSYIHSLHSVSKTGCLCKFDIACGVFSLSKMNSRDLHLELYTLCMICFLFDLTLSLIAFHKDTCY
jgi:hypothetical protein